MLAAAVALFFTLAGALPLPGARPRYGVYGWYTHPDVNHRVMQWAKEHTKSKQLSKLSGPPLCTGTNNLLEGVT